MSVCGQDVSHPGPSPSSAGVLVPPKVASLTSELLAHAKVQLPLNMWVDVRLVSAHQPTVLLAPSSPRQIHTWLPSLPPVMWLKIFPLFFRELLDMFHHLCSHIYSSTSQGWNPHLKKKNKTPSRCRICSVLWGSHWCFTGLLLLLLLQLVTTPAARDNSYYYERFLSQLSHENR